jgi:hypothetical protein
VNFDRLIEDLQAGTWDATDLRKAMLRSAGRNRPKVLNAVTQKFQTGELGEMFAVLLKVGFVFTTEIKDILDRRFQEDPDPKECVRALLAIKEHRIVALAAFQDWRSLLEKRFNQETFKTCEISVAIDQEMTVQHVKSRRTKHEALLLMRAIGGEIRTGKTEFRGGLLRRKKHTA